MLDEWHIRFNKVSQLDAINKFEIVEQQQIAGNRVYEPTRVFRRQFILSHATLADSSNRR